MAETYDTISRNLSDGQLTIKDGSTPTIEVVVAVEEGDLNIVIHRDRKVIMNRGTLDQVREGVDVPVDISWSMIFTEFLTSGTTTLTPYEILTQLGNAAAGGDNSTAGTRADSAEAYCVDLSFLITNPDSAGTNETILLSDFFMEEINFQEGDDYSTLSVSGRAMITEPSISQA
jgi:hypothetical protein